MDNPKFIVSNQKEESISRQRVNVYIFLYLLRFMSNSFTSWMSGPKGLVNLFYSWLYLTSVEMYTTEKDGKNKLYHSYQLKHKVPCDVQGLHWFRWYKIGILFVCLYVR